MKTDKPIGIFDSGLGGLTVVKALADLLPKEDIIYFGDTARLPYGTKSENTIKKFSIQNSEFLTGHDVKLIIVACNTSSSISIVELKKKFEIPFIGVIEPGSVRAVELTLNNKVGVIGTNATINSESYTRNILKLNPEVKVYSQPCPLFVPLVEEGWLEKKVTDLIIKEYLNPLKIAGIDTLILGCTHYPLLKKSIKRFWGNDINLVDSAETCSRAAMSLLESKGLLNKNNKKGTRTFFVSDMPSKFSEIGSRFLGYEFTAVKVV